MDKVIVYRSQSEANADEFWNEIAAPWLFEHWGIAILIILVIVAIAAALAKRRRRFWKKIF